MAPTDTGSNDSPAAPVHPAPVPAKLGRYEIRGELGCGAMGRVYRAFDPNIGRNVALKVIPIQSGDPEMTARFHREARAAGILSHPNIVTIFDAGADGGYLYIAMELVEGETLQKILSGGPMTVEQAIAFSEQTGAALDHAHARAIIHRDVKPANIMVQQGQVKVTDFGVAKIGAAGMTSTGQVLGTPSYLAPEVVKGEAADARSDIFSLGVVLYEMLTGIKPFAGDTLSTVIYRILSEPPLPPAAVVPSLPAGFNYVVLKALAKNPEERYGSGAELVADLKQHAALAGQGQRVAAAASAAAASAKLVATTAKLEARSFLPAPRLPSKPASSRRPGLWAAVAVAALLLGGGIFWRMHRSSALPSTAVILPSPTQPAPIVASGVTAPGGGAAPTPSVASQQKPASAATAEAADKPSAFGKPLTASSTAAGQPATSNTAISEGRVLIRTLPAGALIHLNGDATSYRSPVNFELAPGHYEITIEHAGFASQTKEIDVEANRAITMDVELRRGGFLRRLNPFRR
jgi:eukaryotic-like serine/threonine-protein kinase